MAIEETKGYTPQENAKFWEEVARAEEQFGVDTFCPDPERHRQRWQRRRDKLMAQIAEANNDERERLQQKIVELNQAEKRSAENLVYLRELHGLNVNQNETY